MTIQRLVMPTDLFCSMPPSDDQDASQNVKTLIKIGFNYLSLKKKITPKPRTKIEAEERALELLI